MKRLVKILILCALSVLCAVGLFACDVPAEAQEKGLILKKLSGDDYYTVIRYVDDGRTSTVLDIGAEANGKVVGRIKANAFSGDEKLTEVVVPTTVEKIDQGAFSKMEKLEKLVLPFIGANANSDAYYNQTASAPDKAVNESRIFAYVFGKENYTMGTSVTCNWDESNSDTYYLPASFSEVKIVPADEYSVPMYAFYGNTLIKKVEFDSEKIVAIGDYAFTNCVFLSQIKITKNVEFIGKYAFKGCDSLKKFGVADGFSFEDLTATSALTEIKEGAFIGTKMTEFTVPASVTTIGAKCFASTSATEKDSLLRKVTVDCLAEVIPASAFYYCAALTEATLGNSVTEIREFAFAGVTATITANWTALNLSPNWDYEANITQA